MAASQHRCNAFTANLQRTFSRNNFGLGVLTTLAGTAGAPRFVLGAANNWSGAAAVLAAPGRSLTRISWPIWLPTLSSMASKSGARRV